MTELAPRDCANAGGTAQVFSIGAGARLLHGWRWSTATSDWDDAACMALLSEAERQQAQRIVRADSRLAWQRHRAMLRMVLAHLTDCAPAWLDIAAGQHGKPWLPGQPQLRFNLSHSGVDAVLVAGAADRIGVDIETTADPARFLRLAQRYFPREAAQLEADGDAWRFVRAWTAKEAYLKALGTGLSKPLNSFELALDRDGHAHGVRSCKDEPVLAAACTLFRVPEAMPAHGVGTVAAIWHGAG
jgi:phosphopantetheinyl transferase